MLKYLHSRYEPKIQQRKKRNIRLIRGVITDYAPSARRVVARIALLIKVAQHPKAELSLQEADFARRELLLVARQRPRA